MTTDYRIALSPADLPGGQPYSILGDGDDERFLGRILALANPDAPFAGFVADLEAGLNGSTDGSIVVSGADWPEVVGGAPAVAQARLVVMPLPKRDHWAYWEFFHQALDGIDGGAEPQITMANWKAFTNRSFGAGRLRDFLGLRSALWRRGFNAKMAKSRLFGRLPRLEALSAFDRKMKLRGEYWGSPLEPRESFEDHLDEIDTVRRHLGDQASQDAYTKMFCQYPTLLWEHYLNRILTSLQYFEYCPVEPGDTVLNCGIYDGWELPAVWGLMRGQGEIHNIDPYGFDYLTDYVAAQLPHFAGMTHEHRLALSDRTGEMTMKSFGDARADLGATTTTPCMTIDDFVAGRNLGRVDVIKTDLKGAERYAVGAMRKTVEKYRPKLAISVYHKASDFWALPLQIIEMCRDYDFYFNVYSWWFAEGIFYAIPRERNPRKASARIALGGI
jgi:FkbM family methyltransferase